MKINKIKKSRYDDDKTLCYPQKNKERIKTGIKGLDKMLFGGLIQGRNILLSGPAGSGKTTIGVQFLTHGVNKGENTLYISLEESKKTIYEDMKNLGFDLYRLEKDQKFHFIGGQFSEITYHMIKLKATTENILEEIIEVIKEKNISRVVIDSLNLLVMTNKELRDKRELIASLVHKLSEQNVTSLLISETKNDSFQLSTYGIEEFICDGVIALYNVRNGSKFSPGIMITKMRGTDHDKQIRSYKIKKNGIEVYPDEVLFMEE